MWVFYMLISQQKQPNKFNETSYFIEIMNILHSIHLKTILCYKNGIKKKNSQSKYRIKIRVFINK